MEPITSSLAAFFATSNLVNTLLGGYLGNRSDALLCASGKRVWDLLIKTSGEPENHDIQRAVRFSYLSATLIACDHLKNRKYGTWRSSLSQAKSNLGEVAGYLRQQIQDAKKGNWLPGSLLAKEYEFLLKPNGKTAEDRLPELIENLQKEVFRELERKRLYAEQELRTCIASGWEENGRQIDWYELTCAFFKEELKTNSRLARVIESNYLADINEHVSGFQASWEGIDHRLVQWNNKFASTISRMDEIYEALDELTALTKEIHSGIGELQLDTAEIKETLGNIQKGHPGPIPHHLAPLPFQSEIFLGRDAQLSALNEKLSSAEHPLFLIHGRGGVGKTSFASAYYHRFHTKYAHAAWVLCDSGIANALMLLAPQLGLSFAPVEDAGERLRAVFTALGNLETPSLLIIDNVDGLAELEIYYEQLSACSNLHILLATRISTFREAGSFPLEGLPEKEAIALFKKHFPGIKPEEEPMILPIREAVSGNTLVLELLAKNLKANNRLRQTYSMADLLADLRTKGLLQISRSKNVGISYQQFKKASPVQVIAAMYDLTELDDAERRILSVLAVLPPESLPFDYLDPLLEDIEDADEVLLKLVQEGWMDFNEEKASFQCSPVVQQVVREKNKALLWEDCRPMMLFLTDKVHHKQIHKDNYRDSKIYVRYAESVLGAFHKPDVHIGRLWQFVGLFYTETGNLPAALDAFEKMNDNLKSLHAAKPDDNDLKRGLAISFDKLGEAQRAFGDMEQAMKSFERYADLSEEIFDADPDKPRSKYAMAFSRSRLGGISISLGRPSGARRFFEEAKQIFSELHAKHPEVESYFWGLSGARESIAHVAVAQGKLSEALDIYLENVRFMEKMLENKPDSLSTRRSIAIAYERLGQTYRTLGMVEKGRDVFLAETNLFEGLNEEFPDNVNFQFGLANALLNLGVIYYELGSYEGAHDNFNKARELLEVLEREHTETVKFTHALAIAYERIGTMYQDYAKPTEAQPFFENASALYDKLHHAFPDNTAYKNGYAILSAKLGNVNFKLGNHEEALKLFELSEKLMIELTEAYPDNLDFKQGRAMLYGGFGQTSAALGSIDEAISLFEKAREVLEELHSDYPKNVHYKDALALSLGKLGENYLENGKNKELAREYISRGKKLFRELVLLSPENPSYAKHIEWLEGLG